MTIGIVPQADCTDRYLCTLSVAQPWVEKCALFDDVATLFKLLDAQLRSSGRKHCRHSTPGTLPIHPDSHWACIHVPPDQRSVPCSPYFLGPAALHDVLTLHRATIVYLSVSGSSPTQDTPEWVWGSWSAPPYMLVKLPSPPAHKSSTPCNLQPQHPGQCTPTCPLYWLCNPIITQLGAAFYFDNSLRWNWVNAPCSGTVTEGSSTVAYQYTTSPPLPQVTQALSTIRPNK